MSSTLELLNFYIEMVHRVGVGAFGLEVKAYAYVQIHMCVYA